MDPKERNFVESSKMREFWEDSSFQHLKTSWNNGFQQFSFFRFLDIEYTNLWEEWDEAEGMGSSDEDLVEDFTVGNYPIIDQMYNDWGYNIEYAIVEYMDIVRGIKEGIEDGRLSETRTTIDMFGITEKDTKEIYDAIISEWLSEATGLPKTGSRVRIIKMDDPFTRLTPGDEGIITSYNNSPWGPQLSVQWDMVSTLDLVPGEDEWEVLSN